MSASKIQTETGKQLPAYNSACGAERRGSDKPESMEDPSVADLARAERASSFAGRRDRNTHSSPGSRCRVLPKSKTTRRRSLTRDADFIQQLQELGSSSHLEGLSSTVSENITNRLQPSSYNPAPARVASAPLTSSYRGPSYHFTPDDLDGLTVSLMKDVLGSCWADFNNAKKISQSYSRRRHNLQQRTDLEPTLQRGYMDLLDRNLRRASREQASFRDLISEAKALLEALGAAPATKKTKAERTRYMPAWWDGKLLDDRRLRNLLTGERRRHRVPPEWREATDQAKALWYLLGLIQLGSVCALTINLDHENEAEAMTKEGAVDWFRARVARELKIALGRKVEFYLAAEQSDTGRLHFHGCFGIAEDEAKSARCALRKAAGEWPEHRNHQAKTSANPNARWGSYVVKQFDWVTKEQRQRLEDSSSFAGRKKGYKGAALSVTRGVTAASRQLYNECRTIVIRANTLSRA